MQTLDNIIQEKTAKWFQNSDNVFSETPVPLDEFLRSGSFLNIVKLSDKQYEFIKHGTQIYYDKELEQLGWDKVRKVGELVAFWGKSSGKDFCSQIIQSRIAYLLLCLVNPQKYYDLAQVSSIDMLNMAYNADQAESVFFNTFAEMIRTCSWFSNKADIGTHKIEFDKRVFAYSGNSFEEAFEGKNLMIAVLDEIAAFKTKIELEQMSMRRLRAPRYSAESVYDMAKSSVESRFPNGIGKVISLSFPRFKNDFIQQLYNKGKDEHTCYVSFGTTWDVNPYRKRSDFDDEFRKNPERAESRYACNPSGIEGGYFKNKEALKTAFPLISSDLVPTTDDRAPQFKLWFKCNHNFTCGIHIDLGLKYDKAGIAMAHVVNAVEEVRKDETGTVTSVMLPIVEIDFATSFIAPMNGEIDIALIRQMIVDLISKGFRIGKLTCDQFNSALLLQDVAKFGIETDTLSVDRTTEVYDCLKELVYDNRLKGYSYMRNVSDDVGNVIQINEIIDELNGLILVGGKKVDHLGGFKDVSDAISGAVFNAIKIGLSRFDKSDIIEGENRVAVVASEFVNDREYLSGVNDEYFAG